ncbi:uncharacterized protein LOC126673930 [Mercurialis annua]|uniref:uncharacterized protein LOC126673930 n=1 Tax=Mercurialis annua TaxID=3986 RepID=UPI002160CD79|nr:uncharacterized protein LOC126673930 [Mercurialis annua]XP_050224205.1 uncharacterized protein LOC126673930 [Mercurialis annua]XP_050224206.1 uncharacterized protein LOC126673930 [Mercurialis annua]XP_050224207.1 uncharacterized protein LOC126673930 [Mercurialis annua]XP_050224208.1 uncharacterized protein LOC126673930 [Mercurialis annua]XP_050224209.1 uncharacterized protein LOC126673930 [Mercurialis annua]XP_050224210.1 uncharacterized protein LOC126673930 [Mercurialis annua]XP_05022421
MVRRCSEIKNKNKQVCDIAENLRIPFPSPAATPWLLMIHKESSENQTFYNIETNANHNRNISELHCNSILGSYFGWSILKSKEYQYCLWNPVSLETIKLPFLQRDSNLHKAILTLPPAHPKSKLILIDCLHLRIVFCGPQDHSWTTHDFDDFGDQPEGQDGFEYISMCDGILYVATWYFKKMFMIEISHKDEFFLQDLELNLPTTRQILHFEYYMVESCGQLLYVNLYFRGQSWTEIEDVDVFKLDFSKMEWLEVESLEDRALFLSIDYSMSCSVTDDLKGIEAGCIYYIIYDKVFCYNLEKQRRSTYVYCNDVIKQRSVQYWIMPEDFRLDQGRKVLLHHTRVEQEELNTDYAEENAVIEQRAEEEDGESIITDLPLEVLTLVWERLFLFDYICFRRVCKNFLSVTPPLHWTANDIDLQSSQMFYPCFMFIKSGTINLIDMKRTETYYMEDAIPDSLSDSTIVFSKDGWLLMTKGIRHVFCYNPFKKIVHQLPDRTVLGFLHTMGFSCPPTSSKCSFVGITDLMAEGCSILYFCMVDNRWNRHFIGKDFIPSNNTPVFQNDLFYFLDKKGRLATFRIKEGSCQWKVLIKPHSPCLDSERNYLLECDKEILSVFVGQSGRKVLVFRLDRCKKTWNEVKSLGHHMLFVNDSSCFSMVAKVAGMENKIYCPIFDKLDRMIFYSLDTTKYHTFDSDLSLDYFSPDVWEQSRSCWIQPS